MSGRRWSGASGRPCRSLPHDGGVPRRTGENAGFRIALLAPRFAPDIDGVETHVRELETRFANRGILVEVFDPLRKQVDLTPESAEGLGEEREIA